MSEKLNDLRFTDPTEPEIKPPYNPDDPMEIQGVFPEAGSSPQAGSIPLARKVLVVMTNHAAYPTKEEHTGLWLTELTHFYQEFKAAGIQMDFVSPQGGKVPLDERSLGWLYIDDEAKALLDDPEFKQILETTMSPEEVNPADYQAIYYTGGHGTMWDYRNNQGLKQLAEIIYQNGGVVSAVCHGTAGLLNLTHQDGRPLIEGRKVTGFSNMEESLVGVKSQLPFLLEDEIQHQGADYDKSLIPFASHVVVDGRIVTGQNPGSSKEVAREVLHMVQARQSGAVQSVRRM
ncbi:MAG TPA: type 1 glutamine amidotransferase domain-containing protein [Limnobacter sp.]|nr:type 1 glutamine amidotransferase domain-containing protein [Limnobacter sp.]